MMKVAIIGAGGRVGSNAAFALQCSGVVSEIVCLDVNQAMAEGEALDLLHGTHDYADRYTADDLARFEKYLAERLALIDLPEKDEPFLRQCMLTMYANPVVNHLKALQ